MCARLARVCRLVDDAVGPYRTILKDLFPRTGTAWTIGVTGTPGAGKSHADRQAHRGIPRAGTRRSPCSRSIPTSPFSGGAILGDRISHAAASRRQGCVHSIAGNARARSAGCRARRPIMARVADAWNADIVLIETVGVGQDELEVTPHRRHHACGDGTRHGRRGAGDQGRDLGVRRRVRGPTRPIATAPMGRCATSSS